MRQLLAIPVTLAFVLAVQDSVAENIRFNMLPNADSSEASALSGTCSGTDEELFCDTMQVFIKKSLSAEEAETRRDDYRKQLQALTEDAEQWAEHRETLCTQVSKEEAQAAVRQPRMEHAAEVLRRLESACTNGTKEGFIELAMASVDMDLRTCKIGFLQNERLGPFKKVGERTWVSATGPEGSCGVVMTTTLQHEKDKPFFWTYTQVRTFKIPDDAACEGFDVGTQLKFSWDGPNALTMGCDIIEFGLGLM